MMGPRHISEILPGVIEEICEASELSAAELKHRPWRRHTDEQLGLTPECDDGETVDLAGLIPAKAAAPAPVSPPGVILSKTEVADICRAHFKTFGSVEVAAKHYGLSGGRLSQIQTGIDVSCPRVLKALGITRERSGAFRRLKS